MTPGCVHALAAAALVAAAPAWAQQSAVNVFKGKVREGLYEVKSEVDLTRVPGIPRDKQKSTESRTRCVTQREIDHGISSDAECSVTRYTEVAGGAHILMSCKDGKASDMRFSFAPGEFASETTTTGKDGGATFVSVFRSKAKLVGPCLGAPPAPK